MAKVLIIVISSYIYFPFTYRVVVVLAVSSYFPFSHENIHKLQKCAAQKRRQIKSNEYTIWWELVLLQLPKLKAVYGCVCVSKRKCKLKFQVQPFWARRKWKYKLVSKAKQLCKNITTVWSRLFYFYMHSYIQSSILIQLKKTSNAFELLLYQMVYE